MHLVQLAHIIFHYLSVGLYWGVGLAGVVGLVLVIMTREDAFRAADRQSKMVWIALLLGSSIVLFYGLPLFVWFAMVVVGIYWWDVRPDIQRLL